MQFSSSELWHISSFPPREDSCFFYTTNLTTLTTCTWWHDNFSLNVSKAASSSVSLLELFEFSVWVDFPIHAQWMKWKFSSFSMTEIKACGHICRNGWHERLELVNTRGNFQHCYHVLLSVSRLHLMTWKINHEFHPSDVGHDCMPVI